MFAVITFPALVIVVTTIWMGFDANAIGYYQHKLPMAKYLSPGVLNPDYVQPVTPPAAWFIGGLLCWVIVFPRYLSKRAGYKVQAAKISKTVEAQVEEVLSGPGEYEIPAEQFYDLVHEILVVERGMSEEAFFELGIARKQM